MTYRAFLLVGVLMMSGCGGYTDYTDELAEEHYKQALANSNFFFHYLKSDDDYCYFDKGFMGFEKKYRIPKDAESANHNARFNATLRHCLRYETEEGA